MNSNSRKQKLSQMNLNNYTLSDYLPYREYPLMEKTFPWANEVANKAEKIKYGEERFKQLNDLITRVITPINQVAGHHDEKGRIFVHSKIPEEYRQQVAYHEIVEHQVMNKNKKK